MYYSLFNTHSAKKPNSMPPVKKPSQGIVFNEETQGLLKNCVYCYVFTWLKSGEEFWLYLNYCDKSYVFGFVENEAVFSLRSIDLNDIYAVY